MHKHKLDEFLNGNLNIDKFQKANKKNSEKNDFADSYKKVIEKSKIQVPNFNPFEKIESYKKKRISNIKQLLPYAASILLVLSILIVYQNYKPRPAETLLNEQEMRELQENTELALLYFSKELNVCLGKLEDAKQIQQPLNEIKYLKNIKIEIHNPIKNIKVN